MPRQQDKDAGTGMSQKQLLMKQLLGATELHRAWERDTNRLHLIALELAKLPAAMLQQRLDALEQWERWEVLEEIRHGCKG